MSQLQRCIDDIAKMDLCTDYPLSEADKFPLYLPTSCNFLKMNICKEYVGPQTNGNEWDEYSFGTGDFKCRRVAYLGATGYCCIGNNDPYVHPNPCFDQQNYTCPPEIKSDTNQACYAPILNYCSEASDLETLDANWNGTYPPCLYTIDQWLVGSTTPFTVVGGEQIPYSLYNNIQGYTYTSQMMQNFNRLYSNWGYRLGAPRGSPSYSTIEDNIFGICNASPGNCSSMLTTYCSQYSADDLVSNPNLIRWCGCYLPDSEYAKYVNQYQINKECTPLCNRRGNIPLTDPTGTSTVSCSTDTCLIDNISISLLNTTVNNGINFSQLCGGCGQSNSSTSTSSCTCIMENNTISAVNSKIGGGINLSQSCGSSVCYQDNSNSAGPKQLQIDCNSNIGTVNTSTPVVNSSYNNIFPYLFVGFIILVLLFLLVVWWNQGKKNEAQPVLYNGNPYLLY